VTALRCTAKLAKAIKSELIANPPSPGNRLGEWTANLVRFDRKAYVLAVNERTRLGIVVNAAPYAALTIRFTERIFKALIALGVDPDQAAAEAESTRPTAFAKTNSPSVLATLTRYYFDLDAVVYHDGPQSAAALSAHLLDQIVIDPKHIGRPADRVREAFGLPCKPVRFWRQAANDGG